MELFTYPQRHWFWRILGFLIRRRAELTVITIVLVARFRWWPRLVDGIGHTAALLTAIVVVLGMLLVSASRRFLVRRWWCVTTRHRMRACYKQTRTMTRNGRCPLLLWARPSPVGERVRVWLPAGLAVKDLEQVAEETAAACWAREVRVTPSRRQAAMVTVDVVRRDPLTGGVLTPAMVDDLDPATTPGDDWAAWAGWGAGATSTDPDTGTPAPGASTPVQPVSPPLDEWFPPAVPDVPGSGNRNGSTDNGSTGNGSTGQDGSRTRTRKNPAPAGSSTGAAGTADTTEPPVTGFGGVDVSDYI